MDLFEQMPAVSNNRFSLLGHVKYGAGAGCRADFHRALPSRQTHETDTPDTTTLPRSKVHPKKSVSLKSPFDLKKSGTITSENGIRENRSHVARRSDGTTATAGMGTSCERGVHSSRKAKHLARTRGEGDEVRYERQSERMRRLESKERDRAGRRARRSAFRCRDTRRNHS